MNSTNFLVKSWFLSLIFLDVIDTATNCSIVLFLNLYSHWRILVVDTLVVPDCAIVSTFVVLEACVDLHIFSIFDVLKILLCVTPIFFHLIFAFAIAWCCLSGVHYIVVVAHCLVQTKKK